MEDKENEEPKPESEAMDTSDETDAENESPLTYQENVQLPPRPPARGEKAPASLDTDFQPLYSVRNPWNSAQI